MPAKSERQRRMLGADLARARAGKKTRTGMSEAQLVEYLTGSKKKPLRKKKSNLKRRKQDAKS